MYPAGELAVLGQLLLYKSIVLQSLPYMVSVQKYNNISDKMMSANNAIPNQTAEGASWSGVYTNCHSKVFCETNA